MTLNTFIYRPYIAALFLVACGPATPVPAPVTPGPYIATDAGGMGDVFEAACGNLRRLRCDEGFDKLGQDSCADTMRRAETLRLTDTKPNCVRSAKSVSDVKECGRYCKKTVGYATE